MRKHLLPRIIAMVVLVVVFAAWGCTTRTWHEPPAPESTTTTEATAEMIACITHAHEAGRDPEQACRVEIGTAVVRERGELESHEREE